MILKRSKKTKHALVASVVSATLCCGLLLGTTFAWFTDSVTNTGNTIQAGTLDIELNDGETEALFSSKDFQWEPGRSQKATATVSNEGSLWLKYNIGIADLNHEGGGNDADIADVLDVYLAGSNAQNLVGAKYLGTVKELSQQAGSVEAGVLAPKGYDGEDGEARKTLTIVIKMQESAGNDYQGATASFNVVVNATQTPYEEDGFGNKDYDEGARFDPIPDGVTETNNDAGISLTLEWALRTKLREAGAGISDSEMLTYKDLQVLSGTLDLSGYDLGPTITSGNAAMSTIQLSSLTEEEKQKFDGFVVPWAVSDLAYGLMNVTELDLSNTGLEYIPSMFLIGNPSIEKITLPDTVVSIGYAGTNEDGTFTWGYNSFAWMKSLKTINMPSSLQYLADYSFAESPNLELDISEIPALKQSGRKIFRVVDCASNDYMPNGSKVTGDVAAFADKNKNADLQDFIFEGTNVTADAAQLSDNPLTYKSTFGNIKGITGTLTVPETATLQAWMFDGWSIDTLNISYNTTVLGKAFANNEKLTTINVTYTGEEPTQEKKDAFINSLFYSNPIATVNWVKG